MSEPSPKVAALLLSVLERSADPVVVVDAVWECRYCNEAARRLARTGSRSPEGLPLWQALPALAAAGVEVVLRRAMRLQRADRVELTDRELCRTWEVEALPEGEGLLLWMRDVTPRRRVEEALRQQAVLFDALHEGVLLMDLEARILDWNPAAERLFGYQREEMLGRTPGDFGTPWLSAERVEAIQAVVRESGRWEGELAVPRKDGSQRVVAAVVVLRRDAEGQPIGYLAVSRDITARKRAEEELRSREARFRALIEHATDAVGILDATGTFVYASPAHSRILGYPEERFVGRSGFELLHPEDVLPTQERLVEALASPGKVVLAQYRAQHADGSWRTLVCHAKNLLDDPAVGGIVINSRDVTDQVALEAQLRQSQKMEAVGQLAGGVAHDFNNLLTVIRGNAELLLGELGPEAPLRAFAGEVCEAADRAAQVTRQLLAFSRKQVLRLETVDLNAVVAELEPMLRRLLLCDAQLVVRAGAALPPVHADQGQLGQVLVNLVLNARDAMPQGGTIEVESAAATLARPRVHRHGLLPAGGYVTLAVRDRGVGMSAETLGRVFEPFFTTKPAGEGTGLGLSTVYGIVRQTGGQITVESTLDRGTTFTVWMPVARADRSTPRPAAGVGVASASRRASA